MDAGVRLDQLRKRCYRNKDNVLLNISFEFICTSFMHRPSKHVSILIRYCKS